MQGRPGPQSAKIFHAWAQLPISTDEFFAEQAIIQKELFPTAAPLPGVVKLLDDLSVAKVLEGGNKGRKVHIALATSSHAQNFELKTTHLEDLFKVFEKERRVLGDDVRIPAGRGKPSPDIWELALKTINASLEPGEDPIVPEECLVFEDSVPGVESGRRAGMRVVWVPHLGLAKEYAGKEAEVLAARTGAAGDVDLHLVGELGDGWGIQYPSLENFPYEHYGIDVGKGN